MKKVLILYGWGGSDWPHWQAWLAQELVLEGVAVAFANLPQRDAPLFHEWEETLMRLLKEFQPHTIICHSLANLLWLRVCAEGKIASTCKELILVAPPEPSRIIPELSTFFPVPLPTSLHAKKALLISSTDDPYLSEQEALTLVETLHVKHKIIDNAGHINAEGGYGPWPWMKEYLLQKS